MVVVLGDLDSETNYAQCIISLLQLPSYRLDLSHGIYKVNEGWEHYHLGLAFLSLASQLFNPELGAFHRINKSDEMCLIICLFPETVLTIGEVLDSCHDFC